jgi:1,4-dihydroxy-2-naphthoyl-CoA hydrolase
MTDGTDPSVDQTAQLHAGVPFSGYLGVEGVTGDADELRARLAWDERRCTDAGTVHGGALLGLADVLGGLVASLNLPAEAAGTTTIESKSNFLRPVREGFVEAVSKPLHRGRTTIVVDTELFDPEGRLVARVTQTQAVLYPRS